MRCEVVFNASARAGACGQRDFRERFMGGATGGRLGHLRVGIDSLGGYAAETKTLGEDLQERGNAVRNDWRALAVTVGDSDNDGMGWGFGWGEMEFGRRHGL